MNSEALDALGLVLAVCALALAYLRWLRVAQREHYLPGYTVRFARRWWGSGTFNRLLGVIGVAGAVVSVWWAPALFAAIAAPAAGPIGLALRGKTSKLVWTGRLRRLTIVSSVMAALPIAAIGALAGLRGAASTAAFAALGAPVLVDLALWATRAPEARLLAPYVARASQRLRSVGPRVVAITGSYGKTTTKGYVAHLVGGAMSVVASPANFNNTAGLARALNDHLATGTQVFVAEMGTYGPGEIAAMCEWVTPEVAVITALGPVHLERMGSLENIAEAKAEILEKARAAIVNVDYPLLEQLAQKAEEEGKTVWRCSSNGPLADVTVTSEDGGFRVRVKHFSAEMDLVIAAAPAVDPGNVACAVAAALSLGVPAEIVASRLESLPGAPHRRTPQRASNGASVIDDTYNANPAGAKAALGLLGTTAAPDGKKVVVTPGMVELGPVQARENANFAASAGAVATQLLVVGRTNARALLGGARAAGLPARYVRNRPAAVAWVSANLGPGDAVLYENDLPDHYP
ncbi:MAG TPA: UDP-N-acetylmuramoyl-tripeptide--D-alanyl-D-alanine ligase [Acidimicrobiales bacterium]|nr:UDP-N-acetylmuramoyl-tripeptide--D-alanyl-D-alanine ligase [Acidimicrobiales bacterium]